ncbi:Listeria/Bacterioides repeat-containing protein [Anaerosphaera aminiphila DSM 21120]|uniref:Listeria/Bacterioides repeat-containing protein n=1 Tax=Anaerosphaera aminiphila DSM 21120 TaxID=1120995 RepID=A0A1M5UG41_9FIRM|nr:InlB B-repeat-containing protein [Anaerosphaera aminiphila]SHH61911.1 Listeria/Bacterioides repeat-containing protein [Anaerosphaera aminiphila DSM 21120]
MIVKKNFKRAISFLLAFVMLVTSVLVFPENAEAESSTVNTVEELQNEETKGEDSENKDQESEKQLINSDKTDSEEVDTIKYDANGDDFAILADEAEPSGRFEIKSTDSTAAEPNTPLPGVEITIKDDKGDMAFEGKTGEDGIAKTEVLPKGSYKLKMISPFGYKLENTEMDIKIEKEDINEVNVKAEKNLAGAVLYKIDKDKEEQVNDRALSGAKFDIYSRHDYYGANGLVKTGDKVADGIVTNSGGLAWAYLPPGEYEYEEIEAPEGYKKIEGRVEFTLPLVEKQWEQVNYWVRNETIKYEVSFDTDGGTTVAAQTVAYGDKATKPTPEPTKDGFKLTGWTLNGVAYDFETPVKGNIELVATWDTGEYEVSFDTDGGTTVAAQMITPGDKATKPTPEPTKDGFKFAGWYNIVARDMEKYNFDTPVTEDIKLYAKWTPIDGAEPYGWFLITIYRSDGLESNTPFPGAEITIRDDKNDIVFVGYTDENGILVKGLPVGSYSWTVTYPYGYKPDSSKNPVHDFEIKEEDDTYSTDTGSGKNLVGVVLYKIDKDTNKTLSGAKFNIYSKHKYYHNGIGFIEIGDKVADGIVTNDGGMAWEILPPGEYEYEEIEAPEGYKKIEDKVEFTVPLVENEYDYEYEWVRNEKIKYTVSFDSNGGTLVADQEVGHGDNATVPTPEPTKDGFKLEGWYKDEAHTEKYDFATPITKDVKLYAKWTPNEYTVSFDSVGGTAVAEQTVAHGEIATEPTPEPTKDGYTFIEWQLNGVAYDFTTPVTEDIELVATWEADTPQPGTKYTVTYYGNDNTGGTVPVDSKQYSSGDTVKVEGRNTLYRTNYTFKGWSTTKNATRVEYTAGDTFKITKNTQLYAVWEKDSDSSGGGWTWGGSSTSTGSEKPKVEETLTHTAYLNGYPDNTIRPQGSITRAEVATIFARLKVGETNIPTSTAKYSDVNSSDWYTKYIAFVTDNKIMEGYEDGSFKPNGKITRAEFTAVVARYNSLANVDSSFEDVSEHWAEKYIGSVTNKGWINGYPDGTFKPEKDISREEVATMVNKMLDRKVDKEGLNNLLINNFTDLDNSSWSYFDIVEASNGHKSVRRTSGNIMENWKELIK